MRKIFIIIASLIVIGCHSGTQKPKDLIPKNKLINILVDIHIHDAVISDLMRKDLLIKQAIPEYYEQVLSEYQVTKEQLEATMDYYSTKKEKLNMIYEQVVDSLEGRRIEMQKQN
jgi:hypothetical protein